MKTLIVSDGGKPSNIQGTKETGVRSYLVGHYTVKKVICFPVLVKMITFFNSV